MKTSEYFKSGLISSYDYGEDDLLALAAEQ